MLIPNEDVDRHGEELVDHTGDGERRGGNGPSGGEAEETDEQSEEARQRDGVEGGGVKDAGSKGGENLDVFPGEEPEEWRHHEGEEVVV